MLDLLMRVISSYACSLSSTQIQQHPDFRILPSLDMARTRRIMGECTAGALRVLKTVGSSKKVLGNDAYYCSCPDWVYIEVR